MQVSRGLAGQLVFLSPLGLAGGLALLFGQIFAWAFLPLVDVPGLWEWRGVVETSSAQVVSVDPTSMTVNKRRVKKLQFDLDGHPGVSYSTDARDLVPGSQVSVEYPAGHPDRARIAGMGRRPFPPWVLLIVGGELLIGLMLLAIAIALGLRRLRLLERGTLASAELTGTSPTNVRVNRQRVMRHHFRFTTRDGRSVQVTARSHRPLGQNTDVIYDQNSLASVVVAALPGRPRLGLDGSSLESSRSPTLAAIAVAIPLLGVAGWAVALLVALR